MFVNCKVVSAVLSYLFLLGLFKNCLPIRDSVIKVSCLAVMFWISHWWSFCAFGSYIYELCVFADVWWVIFTSSGMSFVEQAFLVFCGFCLIHILTFQTKIMEVGINFVMDVPNCFYNFQAMLFCLCISQQVVVTSKSFLLLIIYFVLPLNWCTGDLFIDGKVVHRPQYWYNERQPTRNRPRPRYDRRRETMQTQKREPFQRTWGPNQSESTQQTVSAESQNMSQSGGPPMNQGGSQWEAPK